MSGEILATVLAVIHILWVIPTMYFTVMDLRG
jgi:hypothetical protein